MIHSYLPLINLWYLKITSESGSTFTLFLKPVSSIKSIPVGVRKTGLAHMSIFSLLFHAFAAIVQLSELQQKQDDLALIVVDLIRVGLNPHVDGITATFVCLWRAIIPPPLSNGNGSQVEAKYCAEIYLQYKWKARVVRHTKRFSYTSLPLFKTTVTESSFKPNNKFIWR